MGFKITDASFESETLRREGGGHTVEFEVLPRLGANLVSFKVDGRERLFFSRDELLGNDYMTGCFHMFPVPCRLAGCRYEFGGREVRQKKYGEDVFLHGLVRDEVFAVTRAEDAITCTLEVAEGHPVYEGYPFEHAFSLTFTALDRGLELAVAFENRGEADAPFAYGVHPFWRLYGARESIFVSIPFAKELELVDSVPNGRVVSVTETGHDFRAPKPLSEIQIDNVFWGREGSRNAAIEFREIRERLVLEASAEMTHMVGYSPPDLPYVCVENTVGAPNAPNIFRGGGALDPSGLVVVPPGGRARASVRYLVEDL